MMLSARSNTCKLFGKWCSCGKPIEFKCTDTIPDNYFYSLSLETAAQVRGMYLSEIFSSKHDLPELKFGKNTTKIYQNPKYAIKIHYTNVLPTELYNMINKSQYCYNYPSESDTLTPAQIAALNNLDWDGFTSTLTGYHFVDVVASIQNDGFQFLVRLIIRNDDMQIEANEQIYMLKVTNNNVQLISRKPEWSQYNTGKYKLDKLEIIFTNGEIQFINLGL